MENQSPEPLPLPVRKPISKKTRFEVFKRDSFKCQYCGRSSPDVILHIDHIKAVSKGGDNNLINLITSCADCNGGKSNRALDDDSALAKQRAQLEELNVKREQLELMLKWREGLKGMVDDQIAIIAKEWKERIPKYPMKDHGIQGAKRLLKKYSLDDILSALETSVDQYLPHDEDKITCETVDMIWGKIFGILEVRSWPEERRAAHYIKGILRNRGLYVNDDSYRFLMDEAKTQGIDIERIKYLAKTAQNWTIFYNSALKIVYGDD